jgi:hypothetical protein
VALRRIAREREDTALCCGEKDERNVARSGGINVARNQETWENRAPATLAAGRPAKFCTCCSTAGHWNRRRSRSPTSPGKLLLFWRGPQSAIPICPHGMLWAKSVARVTRRTVPAGRKRASANPNFAAKQSSSQPICHEPRYASCAVVVLPRAKQERQMEAAGS